MPEKLYQIKYNTALTSEVHKFACVYLKIRPDQLYKGALYRKMMQYGVKLSTNHPSESYNNFNSSHLLVNIPIRIRIFCN